MERQYKDSGIEWIGKIPETWEVNRFKNKFKTGKGLNITKGDLVSEGIPVISYGQVHSKKNTGTHLDDFLIRYIPSDLAKDGLSSKVSVGDFIFADTSEDIDGCGNAVFVDKEIGLYAGYHSVIAFAKNPKESKYLAYQFLTECWRSQIRMRVTGIKVFSISQAILNDTTIILPPSAEQQRIADYLDEKCGEIDSLIGLQEQMIEKLKAYKQSVITEAVTKGLNPNAKLVPSGIDWIGDIPNDWIICKMHFCVKSIGDVDHFMPESVDIGIPYVMTRDLKDKSSQILLDSCKKISEDDYFILSKKISVEKGDIIFARYATIGTVCLVDSDERMIISYSCVIIKPKSNLNSSFLFYYLKSKIFEEEANKYINTNIQGNIGIDSLSKTNVLLPPLDEQQAIASYLDSKCSEIDKLIVVKQQKIEKLKDYKKSVIYEAVTGKTIL